MQKSGFILLNQETLHEVGGTASLWEHVKTKAQLLSVSNKDENKCFGISFRTPPHDSTGVAHIMEHSVLCGSQKYPVKEPFVELLKGSLQTFLNAFTFPDKTCYPVASANLKDFYNLIDVYLDAVFHPLITKDIFRQEGWHIEAETPESQWSYKGVVFNEMKGAYSSPDSVLSEQSQQALFPDMLYNLDSGGNPENIPDLTYEAFTDFHARFYHPSNARFYFWGDDPEDKRFEILDALLSGYEFKEVQSEIPLQEHLTQPIRRTVSYAAGSDNQKAMFTVNWLLSERGNVKEALQMEMLSHILGGLPGSPLERALISSGLGEETTGCGLETELRQMYYSIGLKGVHQEDIPKAENIIFSVLEGLARDGVPQTTVDAAVNSVEFDYRESNSGHFPRGLVAMLNALSTWLYDGDPLAALAWEKPLADIKERLAKGEKLFENLIRQRLLDNSHRATVILVPDTALGAAREKKEADRIADAHAKASDAERNQIVLDTIRLQEAQVQPDSPEALATIPALTIADLPEKNILIPQNIENDGFTFISHDQPTTGIAYTNLLLPLTHMPTRLVPFIPIFMRTIIEVGTAKRDFAALGEAISASTGGIHSGLTFGTTLDTHEFFRYFSMTGKTVYDKLDDLFDLFEEILLCPIKDSDVILERVYQMLLEIRAQMEAGVQSAGHSFVSLRLLARYSEQGAVAEQTAGVSALKAIRRFIADFEKDPSFILRDIETMRQSFIASANAIFACTAEEKVLGTIREKAGKLLAALPKSVPAHSEDCTIRPLSLPKAEAFITPARVNYVGKSVNLYKTGWTYSGSANVILRYLRMGYLWERVRVRGGAYGAFCSFDRRHGTLTCTSFRDPNSMETLQSFDDMALYLKKVPLDKGQLTQAIVGAIGDLDTYLLPSAKGSAALSRTMIHESDEQRQIIRDQIFATSELDFRNFADALDSLKEGDICVLGGETTEKTAAQQSWVSEKIL